jgi:hypothetical protein
MKAVLVAVVAGLFVGTATAAGPGSGPAQQHTGAGTREAKASLITLRDLGTPWKATGPGPARLRLSCAGFHPSPKGLAEIGSASSPNFAAGSSGPFIAQTTSVLARSGQARILWSRAVRPELVRCVTQSLRAIAANGIKVDIVSQRSIPIANVAEQTAAYRVSANLGTSKEKLKTYFDVVLVQSGRTITELTFSSLAVPLPVKVEHGVALLVARRLGEGPIA